MSGGEDKDLYQLARLAGQALFIPIFLVVFPLAFHWIGEQLDGWFGTTPWLARIFLFLGLFSAYRQVRDLIKRIMADIS